MWFNMQWDVFSFKPAFKHSSPVYVLKLFTCSIIFMLKLLYEFELLPPVFITNF